MIIKFPTVNNVSVGEVQETPCILDLVPRINLKILNDIDLMMDEEYSHYLDQEVHYSADPFMLPEER